MAKTLLKTAELIADRLGAGASHGELLLSNMDRGIVGYDEASAGLSAAIDHMQINSHDAERIAERIEKITDRLAKTLDKIDELSDWLEGADTVTDIEEQVSDPLKAIRTVIANVRYDLGVKGIS